MWDLVLAFARSQRGILWNWLFVTLLGGNLALATPPVVHNGPEPAAGLTSLHLEELWRIGGDEEEDLFFGVVTQALTDDEGNVYLLDTQLSEVLVLFSDGEYICTLSRERDGPGEIRRATGMQWMPDGSLGLVRGMPSQVVRIDRQGNPAASLIPGADDPTEGGRIALRDLFCRDGWIVASGARMNRITGGRSQNNFVAAFSWAVLRPSSTSRH